MTDGTNNTKWYEDIKDYARRGIWRQQLGPESHKVAVHVSYELSEHLPKGITKLFTNKSPVAFLM